MKHSVTVGADCDQILGPPDPRSSLAEWFYMVGLNEALPQLPEHRFKIKTAHRAFEAGELCFKLGHQSCRTLEPKVLSEGSSAFFKPGGLTGLNNAAGLIRYVRKAKCGRESLHRAIG